MSTALIGLKALLGGFAVVGFSLIGQAGHPKRFAGLFSAAPSVALASLAMAVIAKGASATLPYAQGMLIGSAGMVAYGLVSLVLINRLHALVGSILAWLAWFAVAGACTWSWAVSRWTGVNYATTISSPLVSIGPSYAKPARRSC